MEAAKRTRLFHIISFGIPASEHQPLFKNLLMEVEEGEEGGLIQYSRRQ
jgi:hypothetical protein